MLSGALLGLVAMPASAGEIAHTAGAKITAPSGAILGSNVTVKAKGFKRGRYTIEYGTLVVDSSGNFTGDVCLKDLKKVNLGGGGTKSVNFAMPDLLGCYHPSKDNTSAKKIGELKLSEALDSQPYVNTLVLICVTHAPGICKSGYSEKQSSIIKVTKGP